jgi:AcrR family transcriptional regulator
MAGRLTAEKRSRGHKKKERTRNQLIAAGVQALAEKGEALTISDVVAKAEVSNGTFYNYFADRDELIDALAENSLVTLAAQAAVNSEQEDPARRFAFATHLVLRRALEDPTWGRAILRLADHGRSSDREILRYMGEDLATGLEQGRFAFGPDDITVDLLTGFIGMAIRRIVRGDARPDHIERMLARALTTLGIAEEEAAEIAAEAVAELRPRSS